MFDNTKYYWKAGVNYREEPQKYRVGKGEQGVLICEPYKTEILPFWHFKTPEIALESSEKIYQLFLEYLEKDDFIGADMARKYLQMGFTRARRYFNYKGGKKYIVNDKQVDSDKNNVAEGSPKEAKTKGKNIEPSADLDEESKKHLPRGTGDPQKAESAKIFYQKWREAEAFEEYKLKKEEWKKKYG